MKLKTSLICSSFLWLHYSISLKCQCVHSSAFSIDFDISTITFSLIPNSVFSFSAALSIAIISWPLWDSCKIQSIQTNSFDTVQKASSFLKCCVQQAYSYSARLKSLLLDFCYGIESKAQFYGNSSTDSWFSYFTSHEKHYQSPFSMNEMHFVQKEWPQSTKILGILKTCSEKGSPHYGHFIF